MPGPGYGQAVESWHKARDEGRRQADENRMIDSMVAGHASEERMREVGQAERALRERIDIERPFRDEFDDAGVPEPEHYDSPGASERYWENVRAVEDQHQIDPSELDRVTGMDRFEDGWANPTYNEVDAVMLGYDAPLILKSLYGLGKYGVSKFRSLIDSISEATKVDFGVSGSGLPKRLGGRGSGALPHGSQPAIEKKAFSRMEWPEASPSGSIEGALSQRGPHGPLVSQDMHTAPFDVIVGNKVDDLLSIKTGLKEAPPPGSPGYFEELAERIAHRPDTAEGYGAARSGFFSYANRFLPESLPWRAENPHAVLQHILQIEHTPGSQDSIRIAAAYLDEILEEIAERQMRQLRGPTGKFPNPGDDLLESMTGEGPVSIIRGVPPPPSPSRSTLFREIAGQSPDARRVSMPMDSASQEVRREMINAIADNLTEDNAMHILLAQTENPSMTVRQVADMADELLARQGGPHGMSGMSTTREGAEWIDDGAYLHSELVRQNVPVEAHADAIHRAIARARRRLTIGGAENEAASIERFARNYADDAYRTAGEIGFPRAQMIQEGIDPTSASMLGPLEEADSLRRIFDEGAMLPTYRSRAGRPLPPPGMNSLLPGAVGAGAIIDSMSR
tara:strand:- start:677 stop:2545 length:1869 start_codon:yes stop_codon:yes gene_type:complete